MTSQRLIDTESKFKGSENQSKLNADQLVKQLTALKNKNIQDNIDFKQKIDALNNDRIREIEALKRQHLAELDKAELKRNGDLGLKHKQLSEIKATFDAQGRRLDEIILNKDRVNETLGAELRKQKEKIIVLTRNYDL